MEIPEGINLKRSGTSTGVFYENFMWNFHPGVSQNFEKFPWVISKGKCDKSKVSGGFP